MDFKDKPLEKNSLLRSDYKVYYQCQCAKKYDNFPALYLHFQRKHNQRISTRINEQENKIEEKPFQKTITYFIRKEGDFSVVSKDEETIERSMKQVKRTIKSFMVSFQARTDPSKFKILLNIATMLEKYIESFLKNSGSEENKSIVQRIPFLFNGFVLSQMGNTIEPENYHFVCEFLISFASWLKENSLTNLIVEYVGEVKKQK